MLELSQIYTPLDAAVRCLDGSSVVHNWPPHIPLARYAVFANQVATPTHELHRFLSLALAHDLIPLFFEFHADKFVTRNRCKLALARMRFADHLALTSTNGFVDICDIQRAQGRSLRSIYTFWGEPLVDFHHSLLRIAFPSLSHAVFFDGSSWFSSFGSSPRDYYRSFLALFVSQGVLFETYLSDPSELSFTRDIVVPAFQSVYADYGRPPLIVQLYSPELDRHDHWLSYPAELLPRVSERMSNAVHL